MDSEKTLGETEPVGQKRKISKWAIASALCIVLCFLVLCFREAVVYPKTLRTLLFNIMGPLAVAGFIFGVASVVWIIKSRLMLRGGILAVVCIVITFLLWSAWLPAGLGRRSVAYRMVCGSNLMRLGKAMLIYAKNNGGQYPDPNRWCDLLLEGGEVELKHFICPVGTSSIVLKWPLSSGKEYIWPKPEKGRCTYAMNPDCRMNLSPDTVLLFEAKEGWNQFGGPELLTFEHHDGQGCNVLFNDGSVSFWRPRDPLEFNWTGEQKNK